jgi:uncharacterized SAM-binding protein YcdF (DUF218 family)
MKKSDKIIGITLKTIGGASLFTSIIILFFTNVHIGHVLAMIINVLMMLSGYLLAKPSAKPAPAWVLPVISVLLAALAITGAFIAIYGSQDNATYHEDALIVLGAGIMGEEPGPVLRGRLDAAVVYHRFNPNALIVVSGGQGPQEDITEARAMQKYLVANGVDEAKIILEEEATSSYENFLFSKGLLDLHLDGEYTVAFLTNEYHVYRAELTAQKAGFDNAVHLHSATPAYIMIPNMLREYLAVAKALILN